MRLLRRRYLIGATPGTLLASFVPALEADEEIRIVSIRPDLVVVEMTDAHARELRTRDAGRLIIEPDAPLKPLER